jgi:hypothetical protein
MQAGVMALRVKGYKGAHMCTISVLGDAGLARQLGRVGACTCVQSACGVVTAEELPYACMQPEWLC